MGVGKARAGAGDDKVAHQGDFKAAGNGKAVYRTDNRFTNIGDSLAEVPVSDRIIFRRRYFAAQLFEVESHSEGATSAGKYDDLGCGILAELVKGFGDGLAKSAGEGVQRIWPIHGDRRDALAFLDQNQVVAHAALSLF